VIICIRHGGSREKNHMDRWIGLRSLWMGQETSARGNPVALAMAFRSRPTFANGRLSFLMTQRNECLWLGVAGGNRHPGTLELAGNDA